ncbi:DUF4097 family beta strand repeat-containing protein [Ureibacillus thermophilus]|uniref:Uncharacterized protein n=1 Tax=Ureibacillus thermophilus TaxID=367743 RepID=A0A4P6UQZ0_9BACL|nr:DUF4097 family beta strand repeat-containing protein [Ureibacillus thermophilus]QBK25394.1 hypothetical protein DKZ56_05720 [Ureibacillus thermophilus]
MDNERKRIIKLVEEGAISAEEALTLLEALNKKQNSTTTEFHSNAVPSPPTNEQSSQQEQQSSSKKTTGFEDIFGKNFNSKEFNKKMDELMNEVKEDLTEFSRSMMGVIGSAFKKLKEFDLDFSLSNVKVEFEKHYSFNGDEVRSIQIEIPNGKVEAVRSDTNELKVVAKVKTIAIENDEDKTIAEFEREFVRLKDGKLELKCPSKLTQVNVQLSIPDKQYDLVLMKLLNGGVSIDGLNAKLVKLRTYNGPIKYAVGQFENADVESGNGPIEIVHVKGEDLEVQTVNGRIYVDGELREVEAESANGAVIVTTSDQKARKVKAQTVAGAVELYVPKNVSINGTASTNVGKIDLGLQDVMTRNVEDQFFAKTVHFDKFVDNAPVLKLTGESRTGSIIIRYTTLGEES